MAPSKRMEPTAVSITPFAKCRGRVYACAHPDARSHRIEVDE